MKTRFMRKFYRGVHESEDSKTCPGHGSDLVKGKCPDCVFENDGWAKPEEKQNESNSTG